MNASPVRFSGLFSGMDTQSMVQQLMRAEGMRMDRLTRRRTTLQWRRDDLRSTMNNLEDFRVENTRMNRPNSITNDAFWNTRRATVTGSTSGVSVHATSSAQTGSFDVTVNSTLSRDVLVGNVTQAAGFNLNMRADAFFTANTPGAFDAASDLVRWQTELADPGDPSSVQVRLVNGQPVRHTGGGTDFVTQVWRDADGNFLNSTSLTEPAGAAPGEDPFTRRVAAVSINGQNIEVFSDDTLSQFMQRVNNTTGVNATLGFDALSGRFTLTANGMGASATVITTPADPPRPCFLQAMGLASVGATDIRRTQTARDASILVDRGNGLPEITLTNANSNIFMVEGHQISLTSASTGTFTVNTVNNVDNTMDAIDRFVENFNEMIRNLNALHTTPRPRQGTNVFFDPLTDEERRAMSDNEIERWEAQARIGLLHRDQDIRNLQDDIRRAMFEPVTLSDGTRMSLFDIGITPAEGSGRDRFIGQIEITDAGRQRLREALETNPEAVHELFARPPQGSAIRPEQRNARREVVGVAFRLDDILANAIDPRGTLRNRVGQEGGTDDLQNPASRQIREYDDRIEQMQRWLLRRENHFFAMFARIEQAMAQANAQMDSLWMFGQQQ